MISPASGAPSSWAMANSSVDLPQPDSPTIARNSPARDVEVDVVDRDDRTASVA